MKLSTYIALGRMSEHPQCYLGDGVYGSFDGYQMWLRTERDGYVHEIAIDDDTWHSLVAYRESLLAKLSDPQWGEA